MKKKTKKLISLFILLILLAVGALLLNRQEPIKEVTLETKNQPENNVPVVKPSFLNTNISEQDPNKICEQKGLHEVKRIPFESSTLHTCIKNLNDWDKESAYSNRWTKVTLMVSKDKNIAWSKVVESSVSHPKIVEIDKRKMIEVSSSNHGGSCTSASITTYLFDPRDNKSSSVTEQYSMVNDCDDDEITTIIKNDGTVAMNNYRLDNLKKSMDFNANKPGCKYTKPFPNPVVYCEINRNP